MVEDEGGPTSETRRLDDRRSLPHPSLPRNVGPYRVIQRIGEGGMGEVFEAEQETPVRRRVALKVIKRGLETRQVLARFDAERQALALMDHPCVAKVYDAGETESGRPYFAMEYVHGVPITVHSDRHRLSTRERLELFIQVCEGVQHAHQKAVIHRDIKPSNVLVAIHDRHAVPKIIDFGMAKAMAQPLTERTLFTEMGQLIGTPAYMSPEQAEMTGQNIDTRTDVYSLGAMLYELLAGTAPFDSRELRSAGLEGIRRTIREVEPPRPSTRVSRLGDASTPSAAKRRTTPRALSGQLRGDLDWITMKALEKDRTRRYASPLELAADLRRHLKNEPVSASPPSTSYRIGKFVQRHRLGVGVATASVLLVLAFGISMAVQARRVADERDRANRARDESEAVVGFLSDMLSAAEPGEAGRDVTVRAVLDETAATIDTRLARQPLVEAKIRRTMAETYLGLGDDEAAQMQAERALGIRRELLGEQSPETLDSMYMLAMVYLARGRNDDAETLLQEVLREQRARLGDDDPRTLTSMGGLGRTYWQQGRYADARALQESALETSRRVLGEEHTVTRMSRKNLATSYLRQGDLDDAEAIWRESVEIERRVLGEEHPETLKSMNNLAVTYWQQGRYDEAEALARTTLDVRRRVLGEEHPKTLASMGNLASILSAEGRFDEAVALKSRTLEIQRRVLGEQHPNTLISMYNLANAYWDQGHFDEAEALNRETLRIQRRSLGEDHPDTNDTRYNLACLAVTQGRSEEALRYLRDAVDHGYRNPTLSILDDPDLASLRGNAAFDAIVAELRARNEATPVDPSTAPAP